jgi:hypothetical protein
VAAADLYYGPQYPDDIEDYSFCESCRIVAAWIDDTYPGALWVCDESGLVMLTEPTGEWYNPETDEYTHEHMGDEEGWEYYEPAPYYEIGRVAFARAYLDSELVSYCL